MERFKYYHAVIYDTVAKQFFTIADSHSHPFKWLKIQHEFGRTHLQVHNWREISESEFLLYPRIVQKFDAQSKIDELKSRASEFASRRFTLPYDDLMAAHQMQHEWFVIGFQEALSELKNYEHEGLYHPSQSNDSNT